MRRGSGRPRQRGYTLVAMIVAVGVIGLGLAIAGPAEGDRLRREKERELLHVGTLYADAIARYRDRSPGASKDYPATLDDLLLDKRFVGVERHLRALYPDPLDPSRPWGLLRDDAGHVKGVYSQDADVPLVRGTLRAGDLSLPAATRYADWKFVAPPTP